MCAIGHAEGNDDLGGVEQDVSAGNPGLDGFVTATVGAKIGGPLLAHLLEKSRADRLRA